jgi:hypothetical protein
MPTLVNGTVLRLRCNQCRSTFPDFQFSGETDTETAGLGCAASCRNGDLIIASMTDVESNRYDTFGRETFEARIAELLKRPDLRVARLLRVERRGPSGKGMSFLRFVKVSKPPLLIFSCICCADGEAQSIEEMEPDDFIASGGRIQFVGDLSF